MPTRRRHVVFVNRMMPPFFSGAAKNDLLTARELASLGWEVTIASSRGCWLPESFRVGRLNLVGLCNSGSSTGARLLAIFELLPFLLRQPESSLIRVRGFGVPWGLLFAILRRVRPRVGRVIHPACFGNDDIDAVSRRLGGRLAEVEYLFADGILVMNEAFIPGLVRRGYPRDRLFRVRNPVNTERFRPIGRDEIEASIRELRREDEVVVVTVGALSVRKRQGWLGERLAEWSERRGRKVMFLVVGPGEDDRLRVGDRRGAAEAADVVRRLRQLESEKPGFRAVIIGESDRVEEYLNVADIYVHAALIEGEGNAVNEAMACGLPTVLPDHPVYVERAKAAGQLTYKDKGSLVEVLEYLASNAEERARTGSRAAEYIRANRSPSTTAREYATALERILWAREQ